MRPLCDLGLLQKTLPCQVEAQEVELEPRAAFCHCSRCWFDLCRSCAYKEPTSVKVSLASVVYCTCYAHFYFDTLQEMQEVWWGED